MNGTINYHQQMCEVIESIKARMSEHRIETRMSGAVSAETWMSEHRIESAGARTLLLHSCCAPCSTHVLSLLDSVFHVTVYYCNPNIAPYGEYNRRKDEQIRYLRERYDGSIDFIEESYDHDIFLQEVAGCEDDPEGGGRCEKCIAMRLRMTAEKATQLHCDYFATTLSVSPHKNAAFINSCGTMLADDIYKNWIAGQARNDMRTCPARWLPADFKKQGGYLHSTELSKQYGLYRQDYCGCEFGGRK